MDSCLFYCTVILFYCTCADGLSRGDVDLTEAGHGHIFYSVLESPFLIQPLCTHSTIGCEV